MAQVEQQRIEPHVARQRPEWFGCMLGILVFICGILLLGFTFKLAVDLFSTPPEQSLGMPAGKPVNFEIAGQAFVGILRNILLLLLMALVGSLIANGGVKLYLAGRREIVTSKEGPSE
jgi:hypothetical protein